MSKIPVVVIAGPTGVGKTATSIEVAKRTNGEIISADSMQIYRGMDIGTAKVTQDEMQGVPHHMINIVDPSENFSVYRFVSECKKAVADISSRGKLPIIAGGTGLYIDSFLNDIDFTKVHSDEEYRTYLASLASQKGNEYVHDMLRQVDSESAEKIHPNNLKRVIRALEYHKVTQSTISSHNEETKKKPSPYNCAYICLTRNRDELYERIDKRVDVMLSMGLVDEVKSLISSGVSTECTSMQALGYKEIADCLSGKLTLDEAVDIIKRDSRRYAKRQLTWFRRKTDAVWINLSDTDDAANICTEHIQNTLKNRG